MANDRLVEQKFGCDVACTGMEVTELSESICIQKSLHGGIHQRICYCSSDRCNSEVRAILPESFLNPPVKDGEPRGPPRHVYNPDRDHHHNTDYRNDGDWMVQMIRRQQVLTVVWWIVLGLMFMLVVTTICIVAIRCWQRVANNRRASGGVATVQHTAANYKRLLDDKKSSAVKA
jgi:hypothetical protein